MFSESATQFCSWGHWQWRALPPQLQLGASPAAALQPHPVHASLLLVKHISNSPIIIQMTMPAIHFQYQASEGFC